MTVWSPFAATDLSNYDTFDLSVTTADVDTVTATATDASGYITVDVARDSGTWEYIEVQRSVEGSGVWTYVRGANFVDCTGDADDFSIVDYEATNGTSYDYRARATYYDNGFPVTGSWVETGTAEDWTSTDVWLKDPLTPANNETVTPVGRQPISRNRRVGVFHVVGSANPITVSDVRSGGYGQLQLQTADASTAAAITTLLDGGAVLLLQYPAGWDIADAYISIIGDSDTFLVEVNDVLYRTWTLEYIEVDAPADATAGSF